MKQAIPKEGVPPNPNLSGAIRAGGFVFVSGQGPLLGGVRKPVGETIEEQARLTLEHVQRILASAGCTMDDCVKVTVYLTDLEEYDRFNAVYRTFFTAPMPARTVVGATLNFGIKVEVEAIAIDRSFHANDI